LFQAKENRNVQIHKSNSNVSLTAPYVEYDGNNKLLLQVYLTLGQLKTIMLGVRNPKKNF